MLVPDPRRITDEDLETILDEAGRLSGFEEIQSFLETKAEDRFSYYLFTSWNVPGGGA